MFCCRNRDILNIVVIPKRENIKSGINWNARARIKILFSMLKNYLVDRPAASLKHGGSSVFGIQKNSGSKAAEKTDVALKVK